MRKLLEKYKTKDFRIIDEQYSLSDYIPIDLSIHNTELGKFDVSKSAKLDAFIQNELKRTNSKIGFGGYLEQRSIYKRSSDFNPSSDAKNERDIHLGIDIWAPVETNVKAALDGEVLSLQNNLGFGNYGPTIILKHQLDKTVFFSLYGHLNLDAIEDLEIGQSIHQGQVIAKLGPAAVNGDYPSHLHFQLIKDMGDWVGDYPGVCSQQELEFYRDNCPDPKWLLEF